MNLKKDQKKLCNMNNRKKDQIKNDSRGIVWQSSSWLGLGALTAEGRGSIPG